MPSIFRSQLCLPFLFYELLEEHSQKGMSAGSVIQAFEAAFGNPPTEQQLVDILDRLMAEAKEAFSAQEPRRGHSKRTFGTSFSKHLAGLDMDGTCLILADYDPIKAQIIYRTVDMRIALEAAKAKTAFLAEVAGVWYEAVMFGMGGYYKGEGPKDKVFDMTEDSTKAHAELRRLGLM